MTVHAYVGFLLCSLGSLKLFDLQGFADGFRMYDVLAGRWRGYGYVYPFLELALGLTYLSYLEPVTVYFVSVALFAFSGLGVFNTLDGKLDLKKPALSANGLRAPLPIVTAMESVIMVIVALVMLWR